MYVVKVSARILPLPHLFFLCGRANGPREYRASATRTTGKKVIKTDTRTWAFPICGSCLGWIAVQRLATMLCWLFFGLLLLGIGAAVAGVVSIQKPAGIPLLLGGIAAAAV